MTTIPLDAIDMEQDYHRWVQQYLYHLDQLGPLFETTGVLALPTVRASRTDQVKITGGGYVDNIPITDSGASTDADDLWLSLWRYLHAVTDKTSIDTTIPAHRRTPPLAQHPALWAFIPRGAPQDARAHAIEATGWLAELVDHIVTWHHLAPREDELFALIRRMRGRYQATTARRQRPRLCEVCGEHAVVIDWIDGKDGSPKPVQVGLCRSCKQVYEAPAVRGGEERTA